MDRLARERAEGSPIALRPRARAGAAGVVPRSATAPVPTARSVGERRPGVEPVRSGYEPSHAPLLDILGAPPQGFLGCPEADRIRRIVVPLMGAVHILEWR